MLIATMAPNVTNETTTAMGMAQIMYEVPHIGEVGTGDEGCEAWVLTTFNEKG